MSQADCRWRQQGASDNQAATLATIRNCLPAERIETILRSLSAARPSIVIAAAVSPRLSRYRVVNDKRVERIWRQEGLKVPAKQPKRGRLWLADGSCVRLRATHRDHVWSYDFVEDRTHDGRKYRMLNIVDEYTHECLAIRVSRRLKSIDVIDVLSDLFILRGVPGFIRSDNVLRWEFWHEGEQQISIH